VKICIVSYNALPLIAENLARPFGGVEVQHSLLGRELLERGHEVSFVVLNLPPETRSDFRLIEAYDDGRGLPGIRFFWPRLTGLWRALGSAGADVYYQMGAGFQTGVIALFCHTKRIPFVFGTANDSDCDPRSGRPSRWVDRTFYRYGLRRADLIIAQQPRQAALLRENFGRNSRVISSIATPSPDSMANRDENMVLWMGSISSKKQPHLYLDLARSLPQASFHMIGGPISSEPELYRKVEEEAKNMPNLVLHGFLPFREAERLLAKATVFVNTSRFEGFPTTFLQAWAHGVPVVSLSDWPGVMVELDLGRVCPDPNRLAELVSTLLTRPDVREELARNGLAYVRKSHSPRVIGDLFEGAFRELMT
jgi:glycosyltransferase involved in cell wall biosynthesis